jgi:hypothetical protein
MRDLYAEIESLKRKNEYLTNRLEKVPEMIATRINLELRRLEVQLEGAFIEQNGNQLTCKYTEELLPDYMVKFNEIYIPESRFIYVPQGRIK